MGRTSPPRGAASGRIKFEFARQVSNEFECGFLKVNEFAIEYKNLKNVWIQPWLQPQRSSWLYTTLQRTYNEVNDTPRTVCVI